MEIQTKWDPCNLKHKVVSWGVIVKFQWHEWRFVTYIWTRNLVTHFFKAVQLSLFLWSCYTWDSCHFLRQKRKSIQHGTNEDLHILLLSRFYTSPLFYFFWNCSHLHHNILHDTRKIIFSFSPKFCLVVNTSKSSSVLKKTVSEWHVLVKICHDQRLSPHHEKSSSL